MWASVTLMPSRHTNPHTEFQAKQRSQFSEFARNRTRMLIINCSNRMARKCEQRWHSYEQDPPIHVRRWRKLNDVSSPSSLGMEPVSWLFSDRIEWQGNVSQRDIHANKRNPSTYRVAGESTTSVLRVRSEWNLWVDYHLIEYRMAMECEQAWHRCRQDKPIHVLSASEVNEVSSPSSLGMEPVSWLSPVQIEWQGNVSKCDIHANKTNESTYWDTYQSTTKVFWVRSEWNPWVD
jgi:hypothetical protein